MPLYVKDPGVDALATELAALTKLSKTEAVRHALQQAIDHEKAKPSVVELAVQFCRDLRASGNPEKGQPADKAFFDALSGDA
jgi:antitoxin VapB